MKMTTKENKDKKIHLLNTIVTHNHRGYHHLLNQICSAEDYDYFLKQVDTPGKFQKVTEDYAEEMTGHSPIQVGVDSLPKGQLDFLD